MSRKSQEMYSTTTNLSPGQISKGLHLALNQAKEAYKKNTYPIGAVIVKPDGELVAQAHNLVVLNNDPTAHAEMEAIRRAGKYLRQNKYQAILYTTVEPCLMCMGAILAADISTVVWAVSDNYGGAVQLVVNMYIKGNSRKPKLIAEPLPEIASSIREMMRDWEHSRGYSAANWE